MLEETKQEDFRMTVVYRHMPVYLTGILLGLVWFKLLSEELREGIKEYFSYLIKWGELTDPLDFLMVILMLVVTVIGLGLLLAFVYWMVRGIWRTILEVSGLVKQEQIVHVATILDKKQEEVTRTTMMNVGGNMIPTTSTYTEYEVKMRLGNVGEETFVLTQDVSGDIYSEVELCSSYKVAVTVSYLFGKAVDYEIDLSTLRKV